MARSRSTGSGNVLDLIRAGVTTRGGLLDELGWSRVTLNRRLDELIAHDIIEQGALEDSGRGRPRESFVVNSDAGAILAIDIGSSHTRVGVTDLSSHVLMEDEADIGLYDGPDKIFRWADQVFEYLLGKLNLDKQSVLGIGIGVPGPVDPMSGMLGAPQLDPRWDGVAAGDFTREWGCGDTVVAVDRDVNILALAEARLAWPEVDDIVVVKAGIGVGCAFVLDGRIYRGGRGGAGQLSAPLRTRLSEPLRRLETVASGGTVRDHLNSTGAHLRTSTDITSLVLSGDDDAKILVDEVGTLLGYTLADVAGLLNPSAIVIGGNLAELGEPFIDTIRRSVFAASHVYSRHGLQVEKARLGDKAGVKGASLIAQDKFFDAQRISELTRTSR